jgi:molybdenum cofactor biosynthesis enzyme MoaA
MVKKLRLLLFEECNKKCKWCANKFWDLSKLPVEDDFSKYKEISITGGEPMLHPVIVIGAVQRIWSENRKAKIYMYTAKTDDYIEMFRVMFYLDGITVALHNQRDVEPFIEFNNILKEAMSDVSLRLIIFKGVEVEGTDLSRWDVKDNVEWLHECHLPEGEVFKRYK